MPQFFVALVASTFMALGAAQAGLATDRHPCPDDAARHTCPEQSIDRHPCPDDAARHPCPDDDDK